MDGYVIKVEKMKLKSIDTKSEKMQLTKDLKEHFLDSIALDIDEPEKKNQTIQTTNTNAKDDTMKDEHSDRVKWFDHTFHTNSHLDQWERLGNSVCQRLGSILVESIHECRQ